MLFLLNFYWWFLLMGYFKNDFSVVATLATVGNLFYRQNSKMAAKWRHTFWMFLCFFIKHSVWYMLSGVLEVIKSVSSAIMSIRFQLSPYSEQEAQILPTLPPNPVFNRTKWLLDITETPHFRSLWCIFQSLCMKKNLTRGPSVP